MGEKEMADRISKARKAIMKIRDKKRRPCPLFMMGSVGLLDYILTGDIDKILERDLAHQLEKGE